MSRTTPVDLVDQYSHGVLHGELGLGAFERHLAAASGVRGGGFGRGFGGSFFDSRVGLAVRRWCPPILGLDPHVPAVRYLARRRELGAYAAGRALLRATGIRVLLVGTGPEAGTERPARDDEAVTTVPSWRRPRAGVPSN